MQRIFLRNCLPHCIPRHNVHATTSLSLISFAFNTTQKCYISTSTRNKRYLKYLERRKEILEEKRKERLTDPSMIPITHSQIVKHLGSNVFKFSGPMSCRTLATALGVKAGDLLHFLPLDNYTLDDVLTTEMIHNLCKEFNLISKLEINIVDLAEKFGSNFRVVEPYPDVCKEPGVPRKAPVVAIMGHVDHGKTTLLDTLRNTNVVAREAGGITQHIGAFKVKIDGAAAEGETITFIDTPGHEAFTRMRSAGAQVTDIIVLVIAADDSVMPQTVEVIKHAKHFKVPIIVAINKIDKNNADPEKVHRDLLNYEIVTEKYGGNVQAIEISALKGYNIDKLLEEILLQAEVLDLKARRKDCPMEATVIEGRVDRGFGLTTTVIVRRGTMKVGQYFVAGFTYGKIKSIRDQNLKPLQEGYPSDPVEVIGFTSMPEAGDIILQVEDEIHAKKMIEYRMLQMRYAREEADAQKLFEEKLHLAEIKQEVLKKHSDKFLYDPDGEKGADDVDIEEDIEEAFRDKRPVLPIIIKADVRGTLDAFHNIISTFPTDLVRIQIVKEGVGELSDSDIELAKITNAQIIGMNVKPKNTLAVQAQKLKIPLVHFKVIYHLIDYLKEELTKILPPVNVEEVVGEFEFKQSFEIDMKIDGKNSKYHVAGGIVTDGVLKADADYYRVLRFNKPLIEEGKLISLQIFKEKVKEVKKGSECAIAIAGYTEGKKGDKIQAIVKKTVYQTFDAVMEQNKIAKEKREKKQKYSTNTATAFTIPSNPVETRQAYAK
jgi:translation initiation factor IF-2